MVQHKKIEQFTGMMKLGRTGEERVLHKRREAGHIRA